jgi:hydrogenase maturation protein HypF
VRENSSGGNLRERAKVVVHGAVQGVGFRPFVYRLATELQLHGWVLNSAQGVFIEVEGTAEILRQFLLRLEKDRPPRAVIQSFESSTLDCVGYNGFEIRESNEGGAKTALILPDIATCADCVREIFDPIDRRFGYPFTNCTNCGPRFSIVEALPYDRANTSMKKFTMCADCDQEYHDPHDRRFHAQPNACSGCGPQLELWNATGERVVGDPLALAVEAVRAGRILAMKGLGGFQLIVDATSHAAVMRLRERKHREEKPFAVMFGSLREAQAFCRISDLEERLLLSPEAPIVLVGRDRWARRGPSDGPAVHPCLIAPSVAPANPNLGVMLPSTPLHYLLLHSLGTPIVATSGNLSDEPICIDEREALKRLHGIADVFLVHNRPIVRHLDDSIVRIMAGRELVLRRARGYAPLPVQLSQASKTILALGAHLKNTVALGVNANVFVSQHIGDLATAQAYEAFVRSAADLPRLYDATPELIVCDLHPDYLSTQRALELGSAGFQPAPSGILPDASGAECSQQDAANSRQDAHAPRSVVRVQHHWAHVAACMAENELTPPLLGVSWDGTGYGGDGTIWGGEFLAVETNGFTRFAHLRQFRLPGGEVAVKEPRRTAVGLLFEIFGEQLWEQSDLLTGFDQGELSLIRQMLARNVNTPLTSSAGRLFDGIAALIGLRFRASFEGQAAMELEFTLEPGIEASYPFELRGESPIVIDWQPAVTEIISNLQAGESTGIISAKFHNMLVEVIIAVAQKAGRPKIVLSGGCFQNRYLTERAIARLTAEGFRPYWHQRIPPNDGGISLGQIFAAGMRG